MITILDTLKAISNYPVPNRVFQTSALMHDLDLTEEATAAILANPEYRKAKAEVLLFLSAAPAVSEMGVSYSFGESERSAFRRQANGIVADIEKRSASQYGYFGGSL